MNSNNTFIINKYTNDVLTTFNKKYATDFTCMLGINNNSAATSELDKKTRQIKVSLPMNSINEDKSKEEIEALKILIGHELSHHVYDNMSMNAFEVMSMTIERIAGAYRKLMISCCIEVAADIHAEQFYTSLYTEVSKEVYKAYQTILQSGKDETPKNIIDGLNVGYLPASYRILIMQHYKLFKGNDYEILSRIATDISFILKEYTHKEANTHDYIKWIQAQLELVNFPNKPNKLR